MRPAAGRLAAAALAAAAAAGAGSLAALAPAEAQVPGVLGVEARAGAAVGSFAATGAGFEWVPGPAWGVMATWGPSERIGAYAGYSSIGFGCDGGFCRGSDVSFTSRGLSLGARGQAPLRGDPWLRAGILLHDLVQNWSGTEGPRSETADAGPGVEAAAGITWRVGERVSVVPGAYLGFLPTRAEDGASERVFFTGVEVGVRVRP